MSVLSLKKKPDTPADEPGRGAQTAARPPRVRRRPLLLVGTITAVLVGGLGAVEFLGGVSMIVA